MSSTINLSLSNVINVSVLGAAAGLGLPNINTVALFTSETPLNTITDFKVYKTSTDVITDFGSSSKAAAIAISLFSQNPNILSTGGYLIIVPLTAGEKVNAAIARVIDMVYFFGVLVDTAIGGSDFATLAAYMQSIDKLLFYCSALSADYASGGLLDLVRSGSETHVRGMYCSLVAANSAIMMAAAYAGRALSTDFSGSNTASTMHLKALAGIAVDTGITQTILTACQTAGVDVYGSLQGIPAVYTSGTNGFFDEIYNELWLKFALQTVGFNYLRQTNTKVPQTESGIDGLKNAYRSVCAQAVNNRFLAPGSWTSPDTFGNPADLVRNIKDVGYYIYSQPISQQLQADRAARKAPVIQMAVKTAGAAHSTNVIVNVNL